ncbi:uncharacterized protein Z520_01243 [Fonsecaea multimorphosa CBS 102226]|uniref:PhnB-like domain-containing protein n=1 Tax=Fonsecaea multimorphosa CBS 102226 TaxID=1442371 RepID=A0A0D2K9P3_9EURO|nr:uncharacterized protein Z520_01243 [Fonsecaea multimorphosa CBS 102226]KIY02778.1 hypothetical protein Z520_01243 [Fonsecaea multimorphosa CBS 102226]OAL31202.1 hypothetical protein AYO22_01235 [Fonsecaea multimorphosa]
MSIAPISLCPCLFFESQAEQAARFYTSIFPNSSIETINHFTDNGHEIHKQPVGSVMSVLFTLNGMQWLALNSKPKDIPINESVSFQILCEGQEDVDYFWAKLTEAGGDGAEVDESKQICGWVKDRFGVHWQVVPKLLADIMCSADADKMSRAMQVVMRMKKIVIKDILEAVEAKA